MHWRIKLRIVAIREYYWIPKLQQIVESVIRKSSKRERFHTKPFATQQQGSLPSDKTIRARSFQVIGIDFAGPITYHNKNREKKNNSFHILFNERNSFRISARSNHR